MKPVDAILAQNREIRSIERGRLFRKYFLLILALVCGALLISGAIGLYFSYQENKIALSSVQREKAIGAAARIEQFIRQIEQQLAFAALPQLGSGGAEQRRIEFLKLQRLVPAITDIAQIDAQGRERIYESRLGMSTMDSGTDRSGDPAFKGARPEQTWFGPVSFRKETEPYMSIAVRAKGEAGAVTVADVNLKFIWDVVTRIKIGKKGKAYVVDGTGHLVADPDIGLVLRKTDLSKLPQVQFALKQGAAESAALVAQDLAGASVLTAYGSIESLGWKVFVEQSFDEVFETLNAAILRSAALIAAGLLISALVAMWLARSMVHPIRILQEGAARIGAGDLERRIEVKTGDELEALAEQFNTMMVQLRESYAGLERKVEARTAELKQSLEFQGASGEILASISGSISDAKPVFDAIARNLLRLFGTRFAGVELIRDGRIEMAAYQGQEIDRVMASYPRALDDQTLAGQAMQRCEVLQLQPVIGNPAAPSGTVRNAQLAGFNSIIVAPMALEDKVIGALVTAYKDARPFDDKQVTLIKAFADQAVIAIENARLFNETKEALEHQRASASILGIIASSVEDANPVFDAITRAAAGVIQNARVQLFLVHDGMMHHVGGTGLTDAQRQRLRGLFPSPLEKSSYAGMAIVEKRVVHVPDVHADQDQPEINKAVMEHTGLRAILVVPMMREGEAIGCITTSFTEPGAFTDKQIALLKSFSDQAVIAIQNAQLFREIQDKSRQLEIANQHKSEFLANMSHELRTPLNAIIGFSEVLVEKMFGEVNDKQLDYLRDIHSSGKHLLSLINDILDLSKIEAGRMELDVAEFDLRGALQNAMTLVKERAQRSGIALELEVDDALGAFRADERKFKQIMLNLLSNAVKFTPEGGRVSVRAKPVDGAIEIAVEDTGVGIAAEDQQMVFEEFRQVGRDYTRKAEGTGLGLALSRRFVELHGGSIRLESAPGKGSTFTFRIPRQP